MLNKYHYNNAPLLQINIVEAGTNKYFEIFDFTSPYNGYQTDDIEDLLDYIDSVLMERI